MSQLILFMPFLSKTLLRDLSFQGAIKKENYRKRMVFYAEKYLITKNVLKTSLIFEWKRQEIVFITSFNTATSAAPQNPLDQRAEGIEPRTFAVSRSNHSAGSHPQQKIGPGEYKKNICFRKQIEKVPQDDSSILFCINQNVDTKVGLT
jgi:hypothetical protein